MDEVPTASVVLSPLEIARRADEVRLEGVRRQCVVIAAVTAELAPIVAARVYDHITTNLAPACRYEAYFSLKFNGQGYLLSEGTGTFVDRLYDAKQVDTYDVTVEVYRETLALSVMDMVAHLLNADYPIHAERLDPYSVIRVGWQDNYDEKRKRALDQYRPFVAKPWGSFAIVFPLRVQITVGTEVVRDFVVEDDETKTPVAQATPVVQAAPTTVEKKPTERRKSWWTALFHAAD